MRITAFICVLLYGTVTCTAMEVWPDCFGVTMPPNVAPLNFQVTGSARPQAELRAADGAVLEAAVDDEGVMTWNASRWRHLLASHAGESLELRVTCGDETRVAANPVSIHPIDSFLVYRLVLPGYVSTLPHGLYERDLTSFAERALYRNVQCGENQCVNCHVHNRSDPEQYLFHTRWVDAGTQIVSRKWGRRKVNLRTKDLFGGGSYAQWHPSGDFIALSVNETIQCFHLTERTRIEVMDLRSDLIVYALADDRVIVVEREPEIFETYPAWSPDGRRLYSVRSRVPPDCTGSDRDARSRLLQGYDRNFMYDLVVRDFDPVTRAVSAPRVLLDARALGLSFTQPRVSPDGRWLVVAAGPRGCFQLNNRPATFWILDLARPGTRRVVTELSAEGGMSYHTFSHDGKWMVFSSRRDDATYTRPYFTAFDAATGTFTKPFILPVRHPREHRERMMSYNLPEFVTGPIAESPVEFRRLIQSRPRQAK